MRRFFGIGLLLIVLAMHVVAAHVAGAELHVTDVAATHRHGQTFVTWKDAAEGEEAAKYRYALYRSPRPITQENLSQAELCYQGILPHSGRLFGTAFALKDRLDPTKPMSILEEGGKPLPAGSGLAVYTARKNETAYYAVVAADESLSPVTKIEAGASATTAAVEEKVAPIQPIKLYDSNHRGIYTKQTAVTGQKGLPLTLQLHGSSAQGGGAGDYGDYYLYFGTPTMGYRDGLPGVFSVEEHRLKTGNRLALRVRDCIEHPNGKGALETMWFGYAWSRPGSKEVLAGPYTERRLDWILDWVKTRYAVDPQRIAIGGNSMGGRGAIRFGLHRPDQFAAIYPVVGATRTSRLTSFIPGAGFWVPVNLLDDGKTDFAVYGDMPKFVAEHSGELPFVGWAIGRHDGFSTWQEQVDMARAMTARRHGFAFAWNNGGHSEGGRPMALIQQYYPAHLFAGDLSYPAFSHSSLDDDPGNGDPADGDLEGGINLGFRWSDVKDEPTAWSVKIANDLAKETMTVDVTPRRRRNFKPDPNEAVLWTASTGQTGMAHADAAGLVTAPEVKIAPGEATELQFRRKRE